MKLSVAALSKLPGVWRGGELEQVTQPAVATGHAALDREHGAARGHAPYQGQPFFLQANAAGKAGR